MADYNSIDDLSIEISSSADKAVKNLDLLISTLEKLESATKASAGLSSLNASLEQTERILASSNFSKLNSLSNLKISATLGKNLTSFTNAIQAMPEASAAKIERVANALVPMNGLKISKTLSTNLSALFEVAENYKGTNLTDFVRQIDLMTASLTKLSPVIKSFSQSVASLPKSYRSVAASARTVVSTNKALDTSFADVNNEAVTTLQALAKWYHRAALFVGILSRIKNFLSQFIQSSNDYIENMNLFAAAMGDATEEATEFGMKVQNLMGVDFGEWARNQGVFQALATGMGVASEKASIMSQQLTQLGYDISSFYNLSVEDSMTKLQSGIAGELEPLRRIGWDISNARMQLELTRMGIEGNVQSMTQAEKVALRYKLIMEQMTIVHGDMARTIASPANQLRVLQAQMELTARSIGNILIPALNMILPYVIAVVKAIRILAVEFASFFGLDATFEVDYDSLDTSGIVSVGDDLDSVGDSADDANSKVKELKRTIMGFDEINKLNDATSGSNGSGGGAGGSGLGLDLDLPTYDFFEGLTDQIAQKTDVMAKEIAESLKRILPVALAIGGAFAAWKIGRGVTSAMELLNGGARRAKFNTAQTAKNLDEMSKVNTKKTTESLTRGFKPPVVFTESIFNNLKKVPTVLGRFAPPLAVATAGFATAYATSENFRRGVGFLVDGVFKLGDAIVNLNWGAMADGVMTVLGNIGGGIANFFAGLNIDVSFLNPVIDAFGALGSTVFGALNDMGVGIDNFILALGFFTPAAPIFVALEALDLAIKGVGWATSPVIEKVDMLGDVSEETAARFGDSINFMEDAIATLDSVHLADKIFTDEDKVKIQRDAEEIANTIISNLDAERNEKLAKLEPLKAGMSDADFAEQVNKLNAHYDGLIADTQATVDEILDIAESGRDENGHLTEEAYKTIREDFDKLNQANIAAASQSQEELESIAEKWKNNTEFITAEAAGNAIKSAKETKESVIREADEQYESVVGILKITCEEGSDKYNELEEIARRSCEDTKNAARDSYDDIVWTIRERMGEARRDIDFNTGEIKWHWFDWVGDLKSGIDDFVSNIQTSLSRALNSFDKFVANLPLVGSAKAQQIKPGRLPGYASGGFPTSGQLFMAREDGIPEMVGSFGNKAAVANNSQIVSGIEQGVMSAMLQVMSATRPASNDSSPVEIVINLDGNTIARSTIEKAKQLARRGEIATVIG